MRFRGRGNLCLLVGDDGRFSNGLRYPGDPTGPASEVWNWRCTLVASMPGYDAFEDRNASKLETSYEDWKAGRDPKRPKPSGRSLKEALAAADVVARMGRSGVSEAQVRRELRESGVDLRRFGSLTRSEQRAEISGAIASARARVEQAAGMRPKADPSAQAYTGAPKGFVRQVNRALRSGDQAAARAYKAFEGRLVLADGSYGGNPVCWPVDGVDPRTGERMAAGVHLDFKAAMGGNREHAPMQTWFHECAHWIDHLAGKSGSVFEWNTGVPKRNLGQVVRDELSELADNTLADMRRSDPKATMDGAWRSIVDTVNRDEGTDARVTGDLSDMIHGATGGRYFVNLGHFRDGYWTQDFGFAFAQSQEAFAEFFSADICNPGSLAVLKKYLPKSYNAYRNVLQEVLRWTTDTTRA